MKPFVLLSLLCFLGASRLDPSPQFPSEERLNAELRSGMTVGEVIAQFGQPGSHVVVDNGSFLYRYSAPLGSLTAEREGYIGFELRFVEGKVHDWRIFRGNPSYAPMRPPFALKWHLGIGLTIAVVASVYGMIRRRRYAIDENEALLKAYVARQILTRRLPEFSFITHETTLQEVIDQMGPPARTRGLSLESVVGSEKAAALDVSGISITLAEYDLPYHAVAIVMPEYPCEPENKIRATFYRRPQPDEEFPT